MHIYICYSVYKQSGRAWLQAGPTEQHLCKHDYCVVYLVIAHMSFLSSENSAAT